MKTKLSFVVAVLALCAIAFAGPKGGKQSHAIDVGDKDAIEAAIDKDVEIEGTIKSAEWTSSGKVMTIKFENADDTKVTAVIFEKCREHMDQAFHGDVAKALAGAHVRIRGKLEEYKGKPQIKITLPEQITIVKNGK